MADQPANGTEATTATGATPILNLARARDKGRAAFVSAYQEGGELAESKTATAEPAKTEPAKAAPAEPAKKPAEPVDDFADDDDAANEDDDFADREDTAAADADTRKRLDRVQRQEAHAREQLARERADFERDKAAHAAELADARKQKRSKHEAVELLEELGLDEDEWGLLAKRAHARSKEGKADPKWREAADREATGRRTSDDVKSLRQEIAELKEAAKQRELAEQTDRDLTRYFDAAKKLASDDSPLFKRHLAADPDEAHADLAAIAHEGIQKTGKLVPQKKLIAIYESRRTRFLAKFGVDVDALLGKKTTKEQTQAAAKEHAASTTSTTAASPATGAGTPGRRDAKRAFLSSDASD